MTRENELYPGGIEGFFIDYEAQAQINIFDADNTSWTLDKWNAYYNRCLNTLISLGVEKNKAISQLESVNSRVRSHPSIKT